MSTQPNINPAVASLGLDPNVAELVTDLVHTAQQAHPTLPLDVGGFARLLLDQAQREGQLQLSLLLSVRAADLWLARGCAARLPHALTAFDALFRGEYDVVHRRVRPRGIDRDDFVQAAREKLFAKDPPKIIEYSGQGDLRNWLRVTLTRTLLDMSRKRREHVQDESDRFQLLEPPSPGADPELDFMKAHYRDAFRRAFERAARSLDVEDRNLLRQHFVHQLGIDQLATILGVHRATAARRITRARAELMARTRTELLAELNLSLADLDSVLRFVESQVHVTVERVLGPTVES